jgi:hypothetical protein
MEVATMQPIRQVIDDMPDSLSVPPEVRHRRVEITFRLLERKTVEGSFKEALGEIPDIGEDDDFLRQRDVGRGDLQWDT